MAKILNYSLVLTEPMNAREPISIQFLGDISFNDDYIDVLASGKDPFRQIRSTLIKSDLVVGNMECLVEGSAQNLRKKPRIKTTLKAMEALKGLNLSLVSLEPITTMTIWRKGLTPR